MIIINNDNTGIIRIPNMVKEQLVFPSGRNDIEFGSIVKLNFKMRV